MELNIKFTSEAEKDGKIPFQDTCVHPEEDGKTRETDYTGFVHFFRPKPQELFKDFPGPYFKNSRTSQNESMEIQRCTCGSTNMHRKVTRRD